MKDHKTTTKKLYANKLCSLEKNGQIFRKVQLFPRLNQEQTENMNRLIASTEIETEIQINRIG